MSDFYEDLKKYFKETPREKVLKDWGKSKDCDEVGPTVEEYLEYSKKLYLTARGPSSPTKIGIILHDMDKKLNP